MAKARRLLTPREDIFWIVGKTDVLELGIRGFALVETYLNSAVTAALLVPHAIEIRRMSFGLRVDLAIALQVLSPDSKRLLMSLHKVRSSLAHDKSAIFGVREAKRLWDCFTERHKTRFDLSVCCADEPAEVLQYAIAVLCIELEVMARRTFELKLYQEVTLEIIKESQTKTGAFAGPSTSRPNAQAEADRRFRERMARLLPAD